MISKEKLPIIIGGFYRSGTSLVRRLLDAHPRIHCPPEIKFFRDFYGYYPKDDLAHLRFFFTVRTIGIEEEELLRIFGRAFIYTHECAAARAKKERWGDKNPENVLFLRQWDILLPEGFLFIHVVRNPLDALASLKEMNFFRTIPAEFNERVSLYAQFREAGEKYEKDYPDRSFTLSYESLVANPVVVLDELFHFLGERFEPEVMTSVCNTGRGQGLEDPKVSSTREIHLMSVGRWRRDLTPQEVDIARSRLHEWLEPFP